MSARAKKAAVIFLLAGWMLVFYVQPVLSATQSDCASCCSEGGVTMDAPGGSGGGCPLCPDTCTSACSTACNLTCSPTSQVSKGTSHLALDASVPDGCDIVFAGRILSPPSPPPR